MDEVQKQSKKDKWSAVQIKKSTFKAVEQFLDSNYGKLLGYTNKAQVVEAAVAKLIYETKEHMGTFDLQDVTPTSVVIIDYNLDKTVNVSIKSGKIECDVHGHDNCPHLKFANNIPRFAHAIRKYNLD